MSKLRRLDQLLGSLGYGTRREAQGMVADGLVTVKGVVAERADVRVASEDVLVKGQPLEAAEGLLAILHKPLDFVCTRSDGEGATIYELLPAQWSDRKPAVTSVGRLDRDTSGLLLVTDRGDLVQRWTSPKSEVEKVYEVTVEKPLDASLVEVFASGTVMLRGEEKPCLPAQLELVDDLHARLTLMEGRYHQVRRMFASQGWKVTALHRSRFGEYSLEDVAVGEWRLLDVGAR
ncbi:rRNA pseudouridine synthase [Phragmitibacter flavus]|uniref:Pseudouridine synthase n=1 Tax=Phragmitibacter flavus TaxID=2576071 RepID=A0A5R8KGV9_9BACT|nr:pseudouridine synthase [Phragmitibacter flavus]TLD71205.1 rRNA pseudouridine synthase [Phragmitibacter flavus]